MYAHPAVPKKYASAEVHATHRWTTSARNGRAGASVDRNSRRSSRAVQTATGSIDAAIVQNSSRGGAVASCGDSTARIVIITAAHISQTASEPENRSTASPNDTPLSRAPATSASEAISKNGTNANDTAPSTISRTLNRPDASIDTKQPRTNNRSNGRRRKTQSRTAQYDDTVQAGPSGPPRRPHTCDRDHDEENVDRSDRSTAGRADARRVRADRRRGDREVARRTGRARGAG